MNACIKREHFLIPTAEAIIGRLAEKSVFTVMDLKNGFWQLELDNDSADLTTFMTPFGRYRWNRMPFGLNSAPECFMRKMIHVFVDIPNVEVYFDDIFIAGKDNREHDEALLKVIERARENNIKFNKSKVQYRQAEVRFMGQKISAGKVSPDDKHVKAMICRHPQIKRKYYAYWVCLNISPDSSQTCRRKRRSCGN